MRARSIFESALVSARMTLYPAPARCVSMALVTMGKKLSVSDGTTRPTIPVLASVSPRASLLGLYPSLAAAARTLLFVSGA